MARVFIPPLLREMTGGASELDAQGSDVRQIIADLDRQCPGLAARLRDQDRLANGIAVAVDGVVSSKGLFAAVREQSEVHFLPAISGGESAATFVRS